MRWNDLFGDLEGQLAAARQAEFETEVAELAAAERATVELSARLAGSRTAPVSLVLTDGSRVRGLVGDVAASWVLLDDDGRQRLVPLGAVSLATGLSGRADELGVVEKRLSFGHALRAIAKDRAPVHLRARGVDVRGQITVTGRDHVDVRADGGGEVTVTMDALLEVAST